MTRSEDFADGAARVREPKFESVQQQSNRNFAALSVLDNVMPNQNGMGVQDLQRRLVGSANPATGRSQETFDKQLWLRHRDTTARVEGRTNG